MLPALLSLLQLQNAGLCLWLAVLYVSINSRSDYCEAKHSHFCNRAQNSRSQVISCWVACKSSRKMRLTGNVTSSMAWHRYAPPVTLVYLMKL